MRTDWEGALCREVGDPDLWFSGNPEDIADAIDICSRCPLKEQCFQFALDNKEEYGIWGGVQAPVRPQRRIRRITVARENREEVAKSLYRSGMPMRDITKRMGLSRRAVADYLKDIREPVAKDQATKDRLARAQQAKDMIDQGIYQDEIAEILGVTRDTVSRYLRTDTVVSTT